MSTFFKKCITIFFASILIIELISIVLWYCNHPLGYSHLKNLNHEIAFQKNVLRELRQYHGLMQNKLYTWNQSKVLHESIARNNLEYSYPNELIFVFPKTSPNS